MYNTSIDTCMPLGIPYIALVLNFCSSGYSGGLICDVM